MPVEINFHCIKDGQSFFYVYQADTDKVGLCISEKSGFHDEIIINSVILSKSDLKILIKQLNLLIKNLD
jgi:hypothetical protein